MTYTYGLKGAPAVGGGRSGLPRRKELHKTTGEKEKFYEFLALTQNGNVHRAIETPWGIELTKQVYISSVTSVSVSSLSNRLAVNLKRGCFVVCTGEQGDRMEVVDLDGFSKILTADDLGVAGSVSSVTVIEEKDIVLLTISVAPYLLAFDTSVFPWVQVPGFISAVLSFSPGVVPAHDSGEFIAIGRQSSAVSGVYSTQSGERVGSIGVSGSGTYLSSFFGDRFVSMGDTMRTFLNTLDTEKESVQVQELTLESSTQPLSSSRYPYILNGAVVFPTALGPPPSSAAPLTYAIKRLDNLDQVGAIQLTSNFTRAIPSPDLKKVFLFASSFSDSTGIVKESGAFPTARREPLYTNSIYGLAITGEFS